jgi:hypothetical protein
VINIGVHVVKARPRANAGSIVTLGTKAAERLPSRRRERPAMGCSIGNGETRPR